jgi:hypothetical protein
MANLYRVRAQLLALGMAYSIGCSSDRGAHPDPDTGQMNPDDEPPSDGDEDGDGKGTSPPPAAPGQSSSDAGANRDAKVAVEDGRASDAAPANSDGGVASAEPPTFEGAGEQWTQPAPRSKCAEGDQGDGMVSGLDGTFRCNLELVGKIPAPHFLSLAWYKDCAYVNGNDGTTVIKVGSDGQPTETASSPLTELGARSNWESMKASPVSGLLVGYESNGSTLVVYDVSEDCAAPKLQSSTMLEGSGGPSGGHAGNFSPDGTIYYASSLSTGEVFAVDLAMPKSPKVITSTFERGAHDLGISDDGTRAYFANVTPGMGGLAILDVTDVQMRAPGATGKLIKEFTWEDGSVTQYPIPVSYGGVDHLIVTDELGSGVCGNPAKPQWGYARIFDISDEQSPKTLSIIKTEAQDPASCGATGQPLVLGLGFFGVGTHYCNVDRREDPRVLACGNWDAGLRIYDIRNPWRPKELAYFDMPDEGMPGMARINVERQEVWLATTPGTFYVLKIPPGSPMSQILAE